MEKQTITLKGAKLKQIADENETSQLIMFSLADRNRFRSITDISHMKNILIQKGEKIVLEDYMKTWKELDAMGVGAIIYGRNGKPNRFKWNYNLKAVGQSAMSGKDIEVKAIKFTKTQLKETREKPAKLPEAKKLVTKSVEPTPITQTEVTNVLYIPLRSNFVFDAKIPQLSKQEADMICAAIQRCTA